MGGVWEALIDYLRSRLVVYAVAAAVFALGAAAGATAVRHLDDRDAAELSSYLNGYLAQASAPGSSAAAAGPESALETMGRGAILPFLLGLTVIGSPFVLALLFLRGFALGFTLAFLVREYAYKGILLAAVSVLPQSLFSIPAALLVAGSSLAFALSAAKIMLGRREEGTALVHGILCLFCTIVSAALFAASAWVQGSVTPVLVELVARFARL